MQWNRPACRVRSTSGSGVPVIDTSIRRTQRGSNTSPSQVLAPATVRPSTTTAATGGAVDKPLPPNWETRTTPGGKICEHVNCLFLGVFVACVTVGQYALRGEILRGLVTVQHTLQKVLIGGCAVSNVAMAHTSYRCGGRYRQVPYQVCSFQGPRGGVLLWQARLHAQALQGRAIGHGKAASARLGAGVLDVHEWP